MSHCEVSRELRYQQTYGGRIGILTRMARGPAPDLVPILSRGKHRSPRQGACFMEFASFLAGERWSDHPNCTHPFVAGVARVVNDHTSDASRSRLIGLIPTVIGLTGDNPRVDVMIALRCAAFALPVAAEQRQRALAVGLLTGRRVLADQEGAAPIPDDRGLYAQVHQALLAAPHAARWAEYFASGNHPTLEAFHRRAAPSVASLAITGIAEGCIADPDALLFELLATVIDDCTHWLTARSEGTETVPPVTAGLAR